MATTAVGLGHGAVGTCVSRWGLTPGLTIISPGHGRATVQTQGGRQLAPSLCGVTTSERSLAKRTVNGLSKVAMTDVPFGHAHGHSRAQSRSGTPGLECRCNVARERIFLHSGPYQSPRSSWARKPIPPRSPRRPGRVAALQPAGACGAACFGKWKVEPVTVFAWPLKAGERLTEVPFGEGPRRVVAKSSAS
jgi:hypothetical protein